jgi:hypothetical protein
LGVVQRFVPLCLLMVVSGSVGCGASGDGGADDVAKGGTGSKAGSSGGGSAGLSGSGGGQSASGGNGGSAANSQAGGSAGSSGSSSAEGGSVGGGSAGPCGAASFLCTDFEADAIPPELVFFPEYLRANQSLISIDSALARGGSRSLKVTGNEFSQMLAATVPSKFWGRLYLRSDTDIQQGHNTYVAAGTSDGDPNNGEYVRIGEHQCQLELNRKSDDKELLSNGGQYTCSGGVKLLADTWYCLEFLYDGPGSETRVFVDGSEITELHADWGPYEYKVFKLGFEKYHGAAKTLWYDDLALAPERIGCL